MPLHKQKDMVAQMIPPPFATVLSTAVFAHQYKALRESKLKEALRAVGEASDEYAKVLLLQRQRALGVGDAESVVMLR